MLATKDCITIFISELDRVLLFRSGSTFEEVVQKLRSSCSLTGGCLAEHKPKQCLSFANIKPGRLLEGDEILANGSYEFVNYFPHMIQSRDWARELDLSTCVAILLPELNDVLYVSGGATVEQILESVRRRFRLSGGNIVQEKQDGRPEVGHCIDEEESDYRAQMRSGDVLMSGRYEIVHYLKGYFDVPSFDTTARPTPSGGRLDCISVFLPEYNYDDDFHFSNGAYVGQIVQQLRKDLGCEKGCLVEETLLDNPVVGEEPTFSRLMRYDEVLVGGCYEFYSHVESNGSPEMDQVLADLGKERQWTSVRDSQSSSVLCRLLGSGLFGWFRKHFRSTHR